MTADETLLILRRLEELYTFGEALDWVEKPHPLLNGYRAIDCPLEDVLKVVESMDEGVYF